MTFFRLLLFLAPCSLLLAPAGAAVPLLDPRITGTNSQVASGTFAIKSGATLAFEAGALFNSDPGADRLLFWDDSAGALTFLTVGTGLTLSGTTLTTDSATVGPVDATYITQTANGTLTAEQALSSLATGLLQVTTTTGVLSSVTTSAGVSGLLSDETGSGALVFGTSPTIETPSITGAINFPAGVRQTFAPGATNAGLNVGSVAGDPSTPSNGDLWYDSTANELTARINGASVALGAGGGGGAPMDATYITQTADATLTNEQALGVLATGILKNTTATGVLSIAAAATDYVAPGAVTSSGLTMATARLLGRTTASTGAIQEITVGSGLSLSGGELSATGGGGMTNPMTTAGDIIIGGTAGAAQRLAIGTAGQVLTVNAGATAPEWATPSGGGGSGDVVGPASSTDNALVRFDGTTGKLVQDSVVTLADSGTSLVFAAGAGLTATGFGANVVLTAGSSGFVQTASVLRTTNTEAAVSAVSGALRVSGGIGVGANSFFTGQVTAGSIKVHSANGTTIDLVASATATLDFPSIAASGGTQDLTITVTGAATGDSVALGLPAAPDAGVVFNGWVSAANTVTIRATNTTAGAIDPASASYRATVISF